MKLSEAGQVVEVAGATNANKKLAEGWKLLAVVPGASSNGTPHVAYVLGKAELSEGRPPLKISEGLLKERK